MLDPQVQGSQNRNLT